MSSWHNVNSSPGDWGLTVVAALEYTKRAYEFDIRIVWVHHKTGKFYTARDAGCSCPVPFEDYDSLESLDELDLVALNQEIKEYVRDAHNVEEAQQFLRKVVLTVEKYKERA